MDFQGLFREVRDKAFPEINSKFKQSDKIHFMRSSSITKNIYYNPKTIGEMKFPERAINGVIAHELAHQVDFNARGGWFFRRLWDTYRCSKDEVYRRGFERKADAITAKRGFGNEYLEAMKLTKKKFSKDRWKRYEAAHLSIKEMKNLIKNTSTN